MLFAVVEVFWGWGWWYWGHWLDVWLGVECAVELEDSGGFWFWAMMFPVPKGLMVHGWGW